MSYNTSSSPDFTPSVSPGSQSVSQGGTSANYTLTATPSNGFSGTVAWSVTPPSGITASAVSPSGTFTLTAGAKVTPGTYTISITGTSGSLQHTTSASLVVVAASNTFAISIAPGSQTVTRPTTGNTVVVTYTVTVTASAAVSLSATGGVTGVKLSLSPTTLSGSGQATLTVTVTPSAHRTSHTLTVKAVSGTHSKSATALITVQ
jgi:hypothetical protein